MPAQQLVAMTGRRGLRKPRSSTLWARMGIAALRAMVERSTTGHGGVVSVVGPPGIGKSRTVAETIAIAEQRGMSVFSTYCESHTSDVAFQAANRLLRSGVRRRGSRRRTGPRTATRPVLREPTRLISYSYRTNSASVTPPTRYPTSHPRPASAVDCVGEFNGTCARRSPRCTSSRTRTGSIRPVRH